MTEEGHGLYCNIVTGPRHGAGQGVGHAAKRAGHAGRQARGARTAGERQAGARKVSGKRARCRRVAAGAGAQGRRQRCAGSAGRVRQGRCRRTAHARKARGMGTGRAAGRAVGPAGCALGLFSTRFDSVLFLSQFLDIVRENSS